MIQLGNSGFCRWVRGSACALIACGIAGSVGSEPMPAVREILVRFHTDGEHALQACAQTLTQRGRSFRSSTADASDSLDVLSEQLGVRQVRAMFRRPDGSSFDEQRERLRERIAAVRARLPTRLRDTARPAPDLAHVYRLQLPPGADAERAAALYRADPHVVWAQPNGSAEVDFVPDDPFFASSGSWGQAYRDLWGLERIGAPEAWDHAQGEGVVVAVIDTGLDYEHPDIAAGVWINPGEDLDGNGRVDVSDLNGVDDDGNGFVDDLRGFDFSNSEDVDGDGRFDGPDDVVDNDPFDDHGHGTHVAGTIAAIGDNGIGVIGVAPRARIMPLKGFASNGFATFSDLARAMLYAIENGARVINNSWSCSSRCPSNPVIEEVVDLANALGVVVVTSAGNGVDDVVFFSPENRRETIVVAAHTELDEPAYFTNFGLLMDLTAPGAGALTPGVRIAQRAILSLLSSGASEGARSQGEAVVDEAYLRWHGTSMSSPHVAGVVALLLAQRPELSPEKIRTILRISADDIGMPGHDRDHGAGFVDAARALATPDPGMRGGIEQPRPGVTVSQQQGVLAIEGFAAGAEFASYDVAFGFGADPTSWEPLVEGETTPVDSGVLANWPIEELGDGAYALRLRVTNRVGTVLTEVMPFSLERNVPTRVSSIGAESRSPAISGRRVVWESARRTGDDPEVKEGLNLFMTELDSGAESGIAGGPGDQHAAAIDGDRVVWFDRRSGNPDEVYHCLLAAREAPCREHPIARGSSRRSSLALAENRVVWQVSEEGVWRLRLCEFSGSARSCHGREVAPSSASQRDPAIDAARLVWSDSASGSLRLMMCDLGHRQCVPTSAGSLGWLPNLVISGDLWVWLSGGIPSLVLLCEFDEGTGECPVSWIGTSDLSSGLAISGNRVVWGAPSDGEDTDIFYCEYDSATRDCPAQRLTGSAARQRNPGIDGTRIVWEDARDGLFQIYTFEVPSLRPLRDRVVREGQTVRVQVEGRDPSGGVLALDAVQANGEPLDAIGAVFRDRRDGSGELVWRPGFEQAGRYALTFTGTSAGRLETRETVWIEVRDARPSASGVDE